jgi:hypothetical protein
MKIFKTLFLACLLAIQGNAAIITIGGPRPLVTGGSSVNNITEANLAFGSSTTDQGRYSTGSFTPNSTSLILAAVLTSKATTPDTPVLSGNGLNWVQIASITFSTAATPTKRLTVFRAQGSTYAPPFTDAVVTSYPDNVGGVVTQTGSITEIIEFRGAAITGFNGELAVVQVVTSSADATADPNITWAAPSAAANAMFVVVGDNSSSTSDNTPQAGWTEVAERGQTTPNAGLTTEYKLNIGTDITTLSGATSRDWAVAAVEVKAGMSTDVQPTVSGGNFAVAYWQDFEFTGVVSTTLLDAHDHIGTGSYTLFDANSKLSGVTGNNGYPPISTWNGVTDTGTHVMRYDSTGEFTAYWRYDFATGVDNASIGFSVKLPTELANSFDEFDLFVGKSTAEIDDIYLKSTSSSSDNSVNIRIFKPSIYSRNIVISAGTPYWITVKGIKNDKWLLRVYDANGKQVQGEVQFASGVWTNPFKIVFSGVFGGDFSHIVHSQTHDYDNFVVDTATAVFPLGP